ncbi:MAG: hypothetical protein LBT33_05135, partial [Spirochaetia bacterium]|nr:hypothetical protein [Spirochaetia bacterium]
SAAIPQPLRGLRDFRCNPWRPTGEQQFCEAKLRPAPGAPRADCGPQLVDSGFSSLRGENCGYTRKRKQIPNIQSEGMQRRAAPKPNTKTNGAWLRELNHLSLRGALPHFINFLIFIVFCIIFLKQ